MAPFSVVVGVRAIKGVHVPHAEWVVPFYPVVLEVLQELVSIVKAGASPFNPFQATPHKCQKEKKIFRRNGTFALFVRRNGIRRDGMTPITLLVATEERNVGAWSKP